MKKTIGIITALIIIAGGIKFYTAPMSAMANIEDGFKTKNADKIIEHIDFKKLRANIREQMITNMKEKAQKDNTKMSKMMKAMSEKIIERVVDNYLTKDGLNKMLNNSKKEKLFQGIKYSGAFDGADKYKVTLVKDDKKIPALLERSGLFDWKVTEMTLPRE